MHQQQLLTSLESFKKCFELKFEQTPGEEPIYKLGGGIFVDSWPIYRFGEVAELQSMLQVDKIGP